MFQQLSHWFPLYCNHLTTLFQLCLQLSYHLVTQKASLAGIFDDLLHFGINALKQALIVEYLLIGSALLIEMIGNDLLRGELASCEIRQHDHLLCLSDVLLHILGFVKVLSKGCCMIGRVLLVYYDYHYIACCELLYVLFHFIDNDNLLKI